MNAEDSKCLARIKHELRITGTTTKLSDDTRHVVKRVEELEAEVARLNDALKLTDTYAEGLEAKLTNLKAAVFGRKIRERIVRKHVYPAIRRAIKEFQQAIKEDTP